MSRKRKWSSTEKFEIALLAIKNETTINDICKKYDVAPSQVYEWKKQLLAHGANIFSNKEKPEQSNVEELEKKQGKLFEKIGQLTVERDFLKKSLQKLPWNSDAD